MANIDSAKKRMRQTAKRTERNRVFRSAARTYVKKARKFVDAGDLEQAEQAAQEAYSMLDKAARKNIIHPRNAARRKGRLMAHLAAARAEQEA